MSYPCHHWSMQAPRSCLAVPIVRMAAAKAFQLYGVHSAATCSLLTCMIWKWNSLWWGRSSAEFNGSQCLSHRVVPSHKLSYHDIWRCLTATAFIAHLNLKGSWILILNSLSLRKRGDRTQCVHGYMHAIAREYNTLRINLPAMLQWLITAIFHSASCILKDIISVSVHGQVQDRELASNKELVSDATINFNFVDISVFIFLRPCRHLNMLDRQMPRRRRRRRRSA